MKTTRICFAALLALAYVLPANAGTTYRVLDLEAATGGMFSGTALSNDGAVLGNASSSGGFFHAAIFRPTSGITQLEMMPDDMTSWAYAINSSGKVVGTIASKTGRDRPFVYTPGKGVLDLAPYLARGVAINDSGQIAGTGLDNLPAVWDEAHGLVSLGGLGGTSGSGQDINSSGQVTGFAYVAGNRVRRAFVASVEDGMADLGTLGGTDSLGLSINDDGLVTGTASLPDGSSHAFVGAIGRPLLDLGTFGGWYSAGESINALGQVVGISADLNDDYRPFLFSPGTGMVDLNAFLDPALGITLIEATSINDSGQIVAWGVGHGRFVNLLMTPVPEPETCALWLAGLGFVGWTSRRRNRVPR